MLGQYTDPLCSHASGKEVPKATKVMAVISGPMFLAMAVCTPPNFAKVAAGDWQQQLRLESIADNAGKRQCAANEVGQVANHCCQHSLVSLALHINDKCRKGKTGFCSPSSCCQRTIMPRATKKQHQPCIHVAEYGVCTKRLPCFAASSGNRHPTQSPIIE